MERSDSTSQAPGSGPGLSPWIFGLHDPGDWQQIFQDAGRTGWSMFNQIVDDESAARGNPAFLDWSERGFGVLARLVNAPYDAEGRGQGCIPLPEGYEAFARRCAEFVRRSPGCRAWFIGQEMNVEGQWPVPRGSRRPQPIEPEQYAVCFRQVYAAIKAVQPEAWVIPSGLNPRPEPGGRSEDALAWFQAMVQQIHELDGYDLHADFSWDRSDVNTLSPDYAFEQFLAAIPTEQRHLPVFITEGRPPMPWPQESNGWMERSYARVNRWNCNPGHQVVYAMLPYRWGAAGGAGEWTLADKPAYHEDLRLALQGDYRWQVDAGQRFGDPTSWAAALDRIEVVKPGAAAGQEAATPGQYDLSVQGSNAYVLPTDTDLKTGWWWEAGGSPHLLEGALKGEGRFLRRVDDPARSGERTAALLGDVWDLAPLRPGQAAAVDGTVFGARHLILVPVRGSGAAPTAKKDGITTGLEAGLALADRLGDVEGIVLPAISSDAPDAAAAAETVLSTIAGYLQRGSRLQRVVVVPEDTDSYEAYGRAYLSLSGGEPQADPRFWLVSGRPENWARAFRAGRVAWTEMKAYVGQKTMREKARTGDYVLAYRSGSDRFIAGLGRIVRGPYPYQDRHAVDIELQVAFDQGVTLEELKEAVPDLEHLHTARPSFTQVRAGEWPIVRDLIRKHNPGLAPDALPLGEAAGAAPPTEGPAAGAGRPAYRARLSLVEWPPDPLWPGERTDFDPPRLEVHNEGGRDWAAGDGEVVLFCAISADPEDSELITQRLPLLAPLPAGGSAVVEAPFTAPADPGAYQIGWELLYRPGGADAGYEALPSNGGPVGARPRASFRVLSPEEGRRWLVEALAAPSAGERRQGLDRIDHLLRRPLAPELRRMLVEEGLYRGLFDGDWTVGRTALYGLYRARRQVEGLEEWLVAQFGAAAGREAAAPGAAAALRGELQAVRELAGRRLRQEEKAWLQGLLEASAPRAYDGALRFEVRPPAQAWPGEKIGVEVVAENRGTEPWPASGSDVVRLHYSIGGQEEAPQGLALGPGETAHLAATYTLPGSPGDYELTWRLVRGGVLLGRPLVQPVTVLDLAGVELHDLVDRAATGLSPAVRARRLAEIGRRLQSGAGLADAERREIVEKALVPGLFSSSPSVRSAALQALHDLSGQDAAIDDLLRDSLGKPDAALDPVASTAAEVSAQVKDWLDCYLPESLRGRAAPPAVLAARAPAPGTESVTLTIGPAEVSLEYDGKVFKSKNLLDHAALSRAQADRWPPRVYGELLFEGLLNRQQTGGSGSTYDGYVQIKDRAGWHLELAVDPAVPAYRWEYLCNKYDETALPLAVHQKRSFFRRVENSHPLGVAEADPLRILVAICNPVTLRETPGEGTDDLISSLARLDVAQERAIVEAGLKRLREERLAEYKILEGQTTGRPVSLDALVHELKNGYHVLHLLAHGLLHNNVFWLVMEEAGRRHRWVRAEEFEAALTDYGLRLVVLASCQSALPGRDVQSFPGLGALLVRQGIPAVVAMQDNISVESAQIWSQRFYDDLARTGRIDAAMAATRYDLYRYNRRRWDWGIPVLFMNGGDGRLLAIGEERLREAPPPRALEELEVKSYDELPGEGDPAGRALAGAVEAQVRAVRDDPATLAAVRSLIAAQVGPTASRKARPLARQQDRAALDELAHQVQIDARDLARFVKAETGLEIPLAVYQQIASALNAGKHVVLTGAPGTGKTSLAHAICQYAAQLRPDGQGVARRYCAGMAFTTATADWTTFDTIGGFVPTEQQTLAFRPGIFMEAVAGGHWLVIDEINRAEIDKAFGELFTVLSGQQVDLPYKVEGVPVRILPAGPLPKGQQAPPLYWARQARSGYDYVITPSWRIIGTMNVYDKSYLFNMSFAFMRRFAFVDIDLPEDGLYRSLIRRWFDRCGLRIQDDSTQDAAGLQELSATLHTLIRRGSPLMSRRALGPAIVEDMIEYIGDRYLQDGQQEPNLLCYLGEAFQLYALPQLDGLDHEGILEVYAHLHHLFRGLDRYQAERPGMRALLLARLGLLYPHVQADEWERALREWRKKQPGTGAAGGPIVEGETGGG